MTPASSPPCSRPALRGGSRWWSPHPPTGAASTGRSAPSGARGAAGWRSTTTATATTPPTSRSTAWTTCSPGSPRSSPAARRCCAPAGPWWSPPGPGGSAASWSTCPAPSSPPGRAAGLIPAERCVALLAGLRGQRLIPRPSFFQLDNIRKARARGEPWHLIVHEDVLVFRKPLTCLTSPRRGKFSAGLGARWVRHRRYRERGPHDRHAPWHGCPVSRLVAAAWRHAHWLPPPERRGDGARGRRSRPPSAGGMPGQRQRGQAAADACPRDRGPPGISPSGPAPVGWR